MAEVGVLNLTIKDNSTQAATGLGKLTDALTRIKTVVGTSLGLSEVNNQLKQFAQTLTRQTKTTTAIKNLTAFGNAMEKLSKIPSVINFDVKPIADLKKAIGDGINLKGNPAGQISRIRDALSGDWGDGSAVTAMKGIKTVADSFEKAGTAQKLKDAANGLKTYIAQLKELESIQGAVKDNSILGGGTGLGLRLRGRDKNGNMIDEPFGIQRFAGKGSQIKETVKGIMEQQTELQKMQDVIDKTLNDMPVGGISAEKGADNVNTVSIANQIEAATARAKETVDALSQSTEETGSLFQTVTSQIQTSNDALQAENTGLQQVNETLEEQRQLWKEVMDAKNQKRLEENYEAFRELYKSGEGNWETDVPSMYGFTPKAIEEGETYAEALKITMDDVNAYVDSFVEKMNMPAGPLLRDMIDQTMEADLAMKSAQESALSLRNVQDVSSVSDAMEQVSSSVQTMGDSVEGASSPTVMLTEDMKELDKELKSKKKDAADAASGIEALKDRVKDAFPHVAKIWKQFKKILLKRAITAVIKSISSGINEGVENVYNYSNAVGTSLAPAMDNAATALQQFKNSIGAAAAPLIQALVPALQTVVNWLITAINWLNQLFALLGGQTSWTRALPATTEAFSKQTKAAKGAGSAMKDLLADWDELNIIQSNSGGGGGGSAAKGAEDYMKMFEEVTKFDSKAKKVVDFLKKNFNTILRIAGEIAAAVLAWKVSSVFGGIIGTLAGLVAGGATLAVVFDITTLFDNEFIKSGDIGWLIASALTPLVGGFFAKKVLKNVLGGSLAKIAIPLSLGISTVADVIANVGSVDTSAISAESLGLSAVGALKVGGAAAYLAKTLMGHSLGASLAGGAAIALATFGVAIGIKTVARAVQGADTEETLKGIALSSLSMGVGAGLFAKLAGAGAAGAVAFGAAAAGVTLLTLTATIGIAALLTLSEKKKVKWGNREATEDEIKAFVENEVFTASPKTILNIMNPVIEINKENKENLTASVDEVKLAVKKVTIGFNEDDTLDDLKKKVFGDEETGTTGLIGRFKETAQSQENVIETGLTIAPTAGTDSDVTKSIIDETSEGWRLLTGHMDNLGKQLSAHMAEAYKKDISEEAKQMEIRTIQELTGMMARVSSAITQGEAEEKAIRELTENLSNLSQGSWDKMFEYVEEYKKSVTSAYETAYDAVTDAMAGEVAGLKVAMDNALELAGGNENDAEYLAYQEEHDRLKAILDARRKDREKLLNDYAESIMNDDVISRIRTALASIVDRNALDPSKVLSIGLQEMGGADYTSSLWQMLFDPNGIDKGDARSTVEDWFYKLMVQGFGEGNAETLKSAIDAGLLRYGDIINKEVVDELADTIGVDTASPEVKDAWNSLITTLMGEKIDVPAVNDYTFQKSLEAMKKEVEDAVYKIKLDLASLDGVNVSIAVSTAANLVTGAFGALFPQHRAMGGPVRSGDLVMADENGNFEMMGRMGNQPVVANNQQIVNGITQGVATANGDVVSELRTLGTLMQRMLQKELVAKVVPSSSMGRSNQMSAEAYSRVTG